MRFAVRTGPGQRPDSQVDEHGSGRGAVALTKPIEPPPTRWALPSPDRADRDGIAGIGADLEPGTLLAAYRSGLFPMPIKRPPVIAWWSPDPRGVLPLDGLRVTRSLRALVPPLRRADRHRVRRGDRRLRRSGSGPRLDRRRHPSPRTAGCTAWAGPTASRPGRPRASWPAACTAWPSAGSSPASRCSIAGATPRRWRWCTWWSVLREGGASLLDVQWSTDHLASLGVVEIRRDDYLRRLAAAIDHPLPPAFA